MICSSLNLLRFIRPSPAGSDSTEKWCQFWGERHYQQRNLIKRVFCRLNDWRRIAIRYDKLAANFASAVAIATIVVWWT